ncbi:acetyl/propionyl/methylcrotonyl-CoA carboxylase subunit alpha [Psychrobacter sp. DAB_AL62B]|uniref:acetyl/propionyl/methylcrotonyl-CoA carboxylase subunit alpha n=1 Tax=Psychrobacter sp. DAB_AL62B TaxID=1028420 RepID=UPI0023813A15|nr:acetyl/propionyl/methylcrotonyl-CoA carboxylase subunit alpha [Psychrobacter sp. DAB_AL62B]MDE4454566.1 acetyl/propionyl/methylcrotonyl-CoA carboxylase subunit alpha [Psychrobacter sp. DAB_AL62B]
MFSKILIANRGEIACRVAATAKRMGVSTVAVYSDADRHAKHVAVCDEAVYLGGSAPKDSYLKGDAIIAIALEVGAQAIHPGYGFLSENADFAQACQDAGIVFIGPSAAAIRAMGGKSESKRLMETAGVPLIPGYHGDNQDGAFLQAQADEIGYPVLIKASAGGGGKGMRIVEQSADFIGLLESCRREAITSFGNDQVLIEKYALKPRHIEIQVFGDSHGNYVHLFERDCSVQRRHQKVLEEAPAPGVDVSMREEMGAAAIEAARAVNYVGAGTVEFIVEQRETSMHFYFMEMNTRLQVEHPVTEAITGLDLVEWQLLVAAGKPLPKTQDQLVINGHAIEARICAENPDNDFLPATGTLFAYQKPEHSTFSITNCGNDVRIDDGVREGDVISPFYDSMIAKLIVHAPTREQALAKLDRALAQTRIVGLPNNVAFLRYIINTDSFSQANLDTALIEREQANLFDQHPLELSTLVATAVVQQLTTESLVNQTANSNDPFSQPSGFRAYTDYTRQFSLVYNEQSYLALISDWHNAANASNKINDKTSQFNIVIEQHTTNNDVQSTAHQTSPNQTTDQTKPLCNILHNGQVSYISDDAHNHTLWLGKSRVQVQSWLHNETVHIFTDAGRDQITLIDIIAHVGEDNAAVGSLKSPMPGQVITFKVAVGDTVKQGEPLAVIEAMKIEHTITAPTDGIVAELLFKAGDLVADGDELLRLESVVEA